MSVVGKLLNVAHRGIALETVDGIQPLAVVHRLHARQQFLQDFAEIADQRDVHFHVLVDFGGIDLDVNLLGILGVSLQIAGHPVVEAHAQRDQQVRFLDRVIDPGFAVHTHHAQVQRMRSWERSQAEQRQRHRNAGFFRQSQRPLSSRPRR